VTGSLLRPEREANIRPLLLLDIDGVIALLGDGSGEPVFEAIAGEFPVRIAERSPERVRVLRRHFVLVYATSWGGGADEFISPLIGLPVGVPHVPFNRDAESAPGATWKLPFVARFVRDRPAAWVDDELDVDVGVWQAARGAPTLLVHTDPRVGLTDEHVTKLVGFADRVTLDPR
jgi:hypothetical protein